MPSSPRVRARSYLGLAVVGSVACAPAMYDPPHPRVTGQMARGSSVSTPPPSASERPPVAASSAPPSSAPERSRFACAPPDVGFSGHGPWTTRGKLKISVPAARPLPPEVDVIFHFHFSDAARRTLVHAAPDVAIAGLDLGEGSRVYGAALADPRSFVKLLGDVEATLREQSGQPDVRVGRVALSSWSAGFAATTRVLKHHARRIDAVFFLDSLYAPYEKDEAGALRIGAVYGPPLAGALAFARRATRGEATMFVSTSDAPTIGYASTKEVAAWLLAHLGARLPPGGTVAEPARFDRGALHVEVHGGNSAEAHCAHLALAGQAAALWRARLVAR